MRMSQGCRVGGCGVKSAGVVEKCVCSRGLSAATGVS
jgi:hypothetical protein